MTHNNYAFQGFNKDIMARAMGRDLEISTKQSIEMSSYLRHRKVSQAKKLLIDIIAQKKALPFTRFTNGLGHKPGKLASGRYPVKTSQAFIGLLDSVEANAQTKGMNTSNLEIIHICAHRASSPLHQGRHSGRAFKRTHVELVVQESSAKLKTGAKNAAPKKAAKNKETPKTDKPADKVAQKPVESPKVHESKTEGKK
ncbi:MAG: 50S ribosomal protein L22 [Candidatus Woesearchaeota archaeon]